MERSLTQSSLSGTTMGARRPWRAKEQAHDERGRHRVRRVTLSIASLLALGVALALALG